MAENPEQSKDGLVRKHTKVDPGELKFVVVEMEDQTAGGWYREIDETQIEVLSRAQRERVPVENTDAEATAREKIAQMVGRFGEFLTGKRH
jgi:hypothetical protein